MLFDLLTKTEGTTIGLVNPSTESDHGHVVDDYPKTRVLFARMLRSGGFDVVYATDAGHALQMALEGFDAVCIDLAMPGRRGIDLIRELREMPRAPIPIVVISGERGVRTMVGNAGACWCLSKPCTFDDLVVTVRVLLADCRHDCGACPYNRRHPRRG